MYHEVNMVDLLDYSSLWDCIFFSIFQDEYKINSKSATLNYMYL
jgi:hypothetical protein